MIVAIAADEAKNLVKMKLYGMVNISDPNRGIINNFDVLTVKPLFGDKIIKKLNLAIPITFLINSDGIIVWKYVGTKKKRPSNSIIFQVIEEYLNK